MGYVNLYFALSVTLSFLRTTVYRIPRNPNDVAVPSFLPAFLENPCEYTQSGSNESSRWRLAVRPSCRKMNSAYHPLNSPIREYHADAIPMSTSTNPFLNNGTTASTTTTPSGRDAETITSNDIESAEPPPAYTPNERAGEESLQRGPNRPFQPAPPQPSQQPPWNGPHRPWQNGPPPPQGPGRPDFYQGGPSYNNGPPSSQGWGQYPGNSARAPQHPPPTSSAGGNHSGPAPEGSPTSSSDGCPTTVPTPGHPLLRDGKVLVYPRGHECRKCESVANI